MLKNFKNFLSLLEFEKSGHYSNRINIIPSKEKGKPRTEGSRLLPLNQTPFETGYSIEYIRNLDTEKNIGYNSWLMEHNITKDDFQRFLSEIWNFQMDNEIISKRKGNPNVDYIIDPGKLVIKIMDSYFEIYYTSENKEDYKGNKFIILASENTLITLKNASSENRPSWEDDLYQHKIRKGGISFSNKYPNIQSFRKSMRIINLYKKDEFIIVNLDPSNIDSKSAIDSIKEYYGITNRPMTKALIPDGIFKNPDPVERQMAISVGTRMGLTKDKAENPKEVFEFIITELVDPYYKSGNFNTKAGGYYSGGVKDFWKVGDYTTNDQIAVKIKYIKPIKLIYNRGETEEKKVTIENSNITIKKGDIIWLPKGGKDGMIRVKISGFMLDKRMENPFNILYTEYR